MMKQYLFFVLTVVWLAGCSSEPKPINYNKDECAHCMMVITDPKFGSELVTDKGKVYMFDSIECLADYTSIDREFKIESMWISNYAHPNSLTDAQKAFYIVSPKMESPMGMNIGGFKSEVDMQKVNLEMNGQKMNWKEIVDYVKKQK